MATAVSQRTSLDGANIKGNVNISKSIKSSSVRDVSITSNNIINQYIDSNITIEKNEEGEITSGWNVPHLRNQYFSGQEHTLNTILQTLKAGTPTFSQQQLALHGIGGIGKTQLAVEYCYRSLVDESYPSYTLIWWIEAEKEVGIKTGLATLAFELGYKSEDIDTQIKYALRWLRQYQNWLIVFDNVNHPNDIKDYLPHAKHGNILITSQWSNWQGTTIDDLKTPLWTESEALDFLQKHLESNNSNEPLIQLSKEVGFLPLSLAHAAAYIQSHDETVLSYLELHKRYRKDLNLTETQLRSYNKSIAAAIGLSFERLKENGEENALKLLYYCIFISSDGLDSNVFRSNSHAVDATLTLILENPVKTNHLWQVLHSSSLISKQGGKVFIHRIVQTVLLDSMNTEEQELLYKNTGSFLNQVFWFDVLDYETWSTANVLLGFASNFCSHILDRDYNVENFSYLLDRLGAVNHKFLGAYSVAEKWFQLAIEIDKRTHGEESSEYATKLNNYTGLLIQLGRYEEATKYMKRVLEIDKKNGRDDEPEYFTSLHNLASAMIEMYCFEDAELLLVEAINLRVKNTGVVHPEFAICLSTLAQLKMINQYYEDAERLFLDSLDILSKTIGENKPLYAIRLGGLASLLIRMSRFEEAESAFVKALDIIEQTLGKKDLEYSILLHNYAHYLESIERFEEAILCYEESIDIAKDKLGEKHPKYLVRLDNYASSLKKIGQSEKALTLLKYTLKHGGSSSDVDNHEYLFRLTTLFDLLYNLEAYEEAEQVSRKELIYQRERNGDEHPDYAACLNNIGGCLKAMRRFEKAQPFFKQAIEIEQKSNSQDNLRYATYLNNLGGLLFQIGKVKEAKPYVLEAYNIYKNKLGKSHVDTRNIFHGLMQIEKLK